MSVGFTERLSSRGFNFDILDEQKKYQKFLDPLEDKLMDDPITCGEHTFDKKVLKVWIETCLSKTQEVTHPITRKVIAYDPNKPFEDQFPRNLLVMQMIEEFVEEFELANPLQVEVKEDKKSEIKEEKRIEVKKEKEPEEKEEKKVPYPKDFDERFDFEKPSPSAPQIKDSTHEELEKQTKGYPIGFEILDKKNGIVKVDSFVMRVQLERLDGDFSHIYIEGQIAKQIPTLSWQGDFDLLQEFCSLWDLLSQEKIDPSKIDYLKLLLFKMLVHQHGIDDVFQYNNTTMFRSNLTVMELCVLIESFRQLSQASAVFKNVDIEFADLENFFRNISNQKKSILPFENLYQLCNIVPLLDKPRCSSLKGKCEILLGGIVEVFTNSISFLEKSGNWISYALLNEFLKKWKEFYVNGGVYRVGLSNPKIEFFASIAKVCARIHETTSGAPKEFDKMMEILRNQVGDLSDIMTKDKLGVFSVVMNDEIRNKIFSMQENPLFKKMYNAFTYNGKTFFIVDRESEAALKTELGIK